MKTKNLESELWKTGWWVSAPEKAVSPRFAATYRNDGEIESAKFMVAGRCAFSASVNGTTVTGKDLRFNTAYTYDVTDLVRRGRGEANEYVLVPAPGAADGLVRGVVELRFRDGRVRVYGTTRKLWGELVEHTALRKDYPL